MDIVTLINLIILAILLLLTAFFVASEFAVVKIRLSRIDQLIEEGNTKAIVAKKVANDLDYYLSACQLGITVTALGLGALGKPAVERILYPVFDWLNVSSTVASISSYAIAFILVTFLHVVVGEMAPKTLAIQFAEKMTLLLSPSLYWFGKIMYPFIWFLNGASRALLAAFGVKSSKHDETYSEEEIKIIMAQSYAGGEINHAKLTYMENVFSFDERVAKDVMVPRTEFLAIHKTMSNEEIIRLIEEHNYTRYPVTEDGNKDQIIGVINVKKMLPSIITGEEDRLDPFIRDIPFVPENAPIKHVMKIMQQNRLHMVVAVDEYGGTSGLVTLEDILEELVGEIRDEFDADETPNIMQVAPKEYVLNGRVLLSEIEKHFGFIFQDAEDIDTIGGWIQHQKMAHVNVGDEMVLNEALFIVSETNQYQVKKVVLRMP